MHPQHRVLGFDVLRGLCAIGVAYYHLRGWLTHEHWHVLGTYGVYIFFILSGASLMLAYAQRQNGFHVGSFLWRRFLRLAPLLWLVIAYDTYLHPPENFFHSAQIFLNASLLYGLANPGQISLVGGGWSLGIEVVYYLFFPVIIAVFTSWRPALLITLVVLICQWVFVNAMLPFDGSFVISWASYAQPLSFAGYFLAGCLIGKYFLEVPVNTSRIRNAIFVLGTTGLIILLIFCRAEHVETLLTSWLGPVLTVLSIILVLSAGHVQFSHLWEWPARLLGHASYGIYLLHPLLYQVFYKPSGDVPLIILKTMVTSFILALVFYYMVETPIRKIALHVTRGWFTK